MVFRFKKKKPGKDIESKITTFTEQLTLAFSKIKDDISFLNGQLDTNKQDMTNIMSWLQYLHQEQQKVSASATDLVKNNEDLDEKHANLHSSHQETVKTLENHEDSLSEHKISVKNNINSIQSMINHISSQLELQKHKESVLKADLSAVEDAAEDALLTSKKLISELRTENDGLRTNMLDMAKNLENDRISMESQISNIKSEALNIHNERFEDYDQALTEHADRLAAVDDRFQAHDSRFSTHDDRMESNSEALEHLRELHEQLKSKSETSAQPEPQNQSQQPIQQPVQATLTNQPMPQSSFERHIISRMRPNRKSYVLNFILSLVADGRYSTKDLEEVVVSEKQLCGRTSFYAYLKELKLRNQIDYADIDERTVLVKVDH